MGKSYMGKIKVVVVVVVAWDLFSFCSFLSPFPLLGVGWLLLM